VEVGLHQFGDDVDVLEGGRGRGRDEVENANHVRVREVAQEADFAEHPEAVSQVVEGVRDLLDGDPLARHRVLGGGDDAVGL
jgi:hypothetical protein